jgi:hypothetical protein
VRASERAGCACVRAQYPPFGSFTFFSFFGFSFVAVFFTFGVVAAIVSVLDVWEERRAGA